jgi:preprotein translocase subunit SecF
MQLIRATNFDFVKARIGAYVLTGSLIAMSIISLIAHGGPKYGIEFSGGTLLELRFQRPVEIGQVRDALSRVGFGGTEIQSTGEGNDVLIRLPLSEAGKGSTPEIAKGALREAFPGNEIETRRQEDIGPKIGKELRRQGIWAVLFTLGGMLIYVAWRFQPIYGAAGVFALFHDVTITVGFFSITGKEITLPVLAALLTIVGYSINDTVVVFDRIRENLRVFHRDTFGTIMNNAINQTLSRTIITSWTVILVLLFLFFFGGEVIHDFSFALLIGVVVGTYSSVCVASPIVYEWTMRHPAKAGATKKM